MSSIVVDEFIISLGLEDKVTDALRKIERETEQYLKGVEARLSKLRFNGGTGGGLPSTGGAPRPTRPKNFDDRAYAVANSAMMNKMMGGNAQSAMAAMEAKSKVWAAAGRANLDQSTSAFRRTIIDTQNGLRTFNQRANGAGAAFNRSSRGVNQLGSSSSHAHNGLQKMMTGFLALHTVVHLLKEAIAEGVERQRAQNAMRVAYSKNGEADAQMAEVKKLSDKYGTNLSEALQQSANLKTLMGNFLTDAQIAQYHESLVVGGGATGANADQMQRFSVALEKMAGMKTGGGAVFTQLQRNMAPLMGMIAKQQGKTLSEFREWAKTQSGSKVAQAIVSNMAKVLDSKIQDKHGNETSVRELYASSLGVALSRVSQDLIDSGTKFTDSSEEGLAEFSRAISDFLRNNDWIFVDLGNLFGDMLHSLVPIIQTLNDFFVTLDNLGAAFEHWKLNQSAAIQEMVNGFTGVAKMLVEGGLFYKAVQAAAAVLMSLPGAGAVKAAITGGTAAKVGATVAETGGGAMVANAASKRVAGGYITRLLAGDVAAGGMGEGLAAWGIGASSAIVDSPMIAAAIAAGTYVATKDANNDYKSYNTEEKTKMSGVRFGYAGIGSEANWLTLPERSKIDNPPSSNPVVQQQSAEIKVQAPEWKPIQSTLLLDLSLAQQQITQQIKTEVQDSHDFVTVGQSPMSNYHPNVSLARQ